MQEFLHSIFACLTLFYDSDQRKNVVGVVACFPVGVQSETQQNPKFIKAYKYKGF
ncbi:hypothetical protein BDGGKGIB_02404 [Nodularia sphaerocarpa UHCC 0038]|nr:hypothetical protein BDGGKGIB_02404 [Nodularia sphaerocarpa UHCC 0038]